MMLLVGFLNLLLYIQFGHIISFMACMYCCVYVIIMNLGEQD